MGLPPPAQPADPLLDTYAIAAGGLVENVDIRVGGLAYEPRNKREGGVGPAAGYVTRSAVSEAEVSSTCVFLGGEREREKR